MENTLRTHLETLARIFGAATGREPSTVARLATGDWRFFDRLDSGASFTARRYDAIMAWFATNWPVETDWPVAVPRPVVEAVHVVASADDANLNGAAVHGAEKSEANISRTEPVQ